MGHMSYNRVGRKCHGMRGFRLNLKRFSVQRLRAKFFLIFKIITSWKSTYGNAFESLKRNLSRNAVKKDRSTTTTTTSSRRNLVRKDVTNIYHYRLKSFGRSNSFYSEAIADCIEFIKRTSVSLDDDKQD